VRRRLLFLAVPVLAAIGFALPSAQADSVCLNAHVEVNGQVLVDQAQCQELPAPPALP
jgi:hypothetical protein